MRVALRFVAVLCLAAIARPVSAKGAPKDPGPVRLGAPAVEAALLDCRSPVVAHEIRVAFGTATTFGAATVTFRAGEKGAVTASIAAAGPGGAPSVSTQTLARLPALLTFEAFGRPYALSIRLSEDPVGVAVGSAFGLAIPVGGEIAWLVDSDRDGTLGSEGDGIVAPGSRTVAPWCGEAWTRTAAVSVRRDTMTAEWRVESLPMPHPNDASHAAAWRLLQWRRQQVGLLPVAYDASLESGLVAHLDYLAKNRVTSHEEDPKRPGYSEAGDAAGRESSLAPGVAGCVEGIEALMGTLFHRDDCLGPALSRTAMAIRSGYFGLLARIFDGPLRDAVYVYPAHGMTDVTRSFGSSGEIPMPLPVSIETKLGLCISAAGLGFRRSALESPPSLVVSTGSKKGAPSVEGTLCYPGHAGGSAVGEDYAGMIALVPGSPLPALTTFHCRVRIPWPGAELAAAVGQPTHFAFEWEFTTGR